MAKQTNKKKEVSMGMFKKKEIKKPESPKIELLLQTENYRFFRRGDEFLVQYKRINSINETTWVDTSIDRVYPGEKKEDTQMYAVLNHLYPRKCNCNE